MSFLGRFEFMAVSKASFGARHLGKSVRWKGENKYEENSLFIKGHIDHETRGT